MSDGNFNRSLLPKNELSAGLRAGKAQMRAKAERAFKDTLDNFFSDVPEEVRKHAIEDFKQRLK